MTTQEFENLIRRKAQDIEAYVNTRFPAQAGDTALRFINGNFRAQGHQGATFKRWKQNTRNGTVLVGRGHLRSATYYTTENGMALIKNTMPYSKIHNEGGEIPITNKMRRFFWAMYYKEKGSMSRTTSGKIRNNKRNRRITEISNIWKNMALTKKTKLTIPQRQFAPMSNENNPVLNRAVLRKIEQELQRIFNL